jgi:hypothetical protein
MSASEAHSPSKFIPDPRSRGRLVTICNHSVPARSLYRRVALLAESGVPGHPGA